MEKVFVFHTLSGSVGQNIQQHFVSNNLLSNHLLSSPEYPMTMLDSGPDPKSFLAWILIS